MAVYFDYNAAAPLRSCALEKMVEVLSLTGNPASIHHFGRQLSAILESTRHSIAKLVGAQGSEIIFTSCASEANTMVVQGARAQGYRVLVGATDHASVLDVTDQALHIPVDQTGIIRADILENLLQDAQPTLVSIQAANGETGVLQPLETLIPLVKSYQAFFHTDAVQALGRIPLNFKTLGCDGMSLTSSKIGGPSGAGCLIVKDSFILPALIRGGGQEKYRRAGTSAVAALAGFGAAFQEAVLEDWEPVKALRDFLEQRLVSLYPSVEIVGQAAPRLPNTTSVRLPGLANSLQLMKLDLAGFAVSAGSACSAGKIDPSTVLMAMGLSSQQAQETLRISLGPQNTLTEVEAFIQAWASLLPTSQAA